jgi:hypothetical protein
MADLWEATASFPHLSAGSTAERDRILAAFGLAAADVPTVAGGITYIANRTWPVQRVLPMYELISGTDGSTWLSVNRIHRYNMPWPAVVAAYQELMNLSGQSPTITPVPDLAAFGTPVKYNGTPTAP